MTDLLERLQEMRGFAVAECKNPVITLLLSDIDEVIEALRPIEDEEVRKLVQNLFLTPGCPSMAIVLIERLARERRECARQYQEAMDQVAEQMHRAKTAEGVAQQRFQHMADGQKKLEAVKAQCRELESVVERISQGLTWDADTTSTAEEYACRELERICAMGESE